MTLEEYDCIRTGINTKRLEYVKHWANQFEANPLDLLHVYKYES